MSFWTGKKETLLQSLVEATFKAVLSGLVIALVARVLVVMVDNQIEVASKRDALNTFRNDRLTTLTTEFSQAFLEMDCTRSLRTVDDANCNSALSLFVTNLDAIFLELRLHYPDQAFAALLALKQQAEEIRKNAAEVEESQLDTFAAAFGAALDEMSQNFR